MKSKQKIIVLGAGFVGKPLAEYLKADIITKRLNEINESDLEKYDVVVNAVAKTDNNWCEKNVVDAFDTNVTQTVRIARLVKNKYVFFSTGCVFMSENERDVKDESSIPNPQCFYTRTKLMAEQLISAINPGTLILRPRLIISEKSHPRNIIDRLFTYSDIITTQESFTILEDMLPVIAKLIATKASGVYNIVNSGTISPSEIMDIFGKGHNKILMSELQTLISGKARKVSAILKSNKIPSLQDIKKRVKEIKDNWGK